MPVLGHYLFQETNTVSREKARASIVIVLVRHSTGFKHRTYNFEYFFVHSFFLSKKKNSPFHLTVSNIYNKQKLFVIEAIIYSFIDAFI